VPRPRVTRTSHVTRTFAHRARRPSPTLTGPGNYADDTTTHGARGSPAPPGFRQGGLSAAVRQPRFGSVSARPGPVIANGRPSCGDIDFEKADNLKPFLVHRRVSIVAFRSCRKGPTSWEPMLRVPATKYLTPRKCADCEASALVVRHRDFDEPSAPIRCARQGTRREHSHSYVTDEVTPHRAAQWRAQAVRISVADC
jgi:hypothetical protein